MAVLQMQRISICALKRDRKAILENLQSMGVIEMNQIADGDDGFEKMDTQNARVGFEKKAQLSENALAILESYAPQKQSLLSSLEGKALIGKKKFDNTVAAKETITAKADTLVALNKEIAENKANILKLSNQIESLSPWLNLDVPMNYNGTDKVAMLLGTMAPDTISTTLPKYPPNSTPHTSVETPQNMNIFRDLCMPSPILGYFFSTIKQAIAIIAPYAASDNIIPKKNT